MKGIVPIELVDEALRALATLGRRHARHIADLAHHVEVGMHLVVQTRRLAELRDQIDETLCIERNGRVLLLKRTLRARGSL